MHPYITFIVQALRGANPDQYFEQYSKHILSAARMLQTRSMLTSRKVYRGIMLTPQDIRGDKLHPLSHVRFVSFSESIEIAKTFADLEHPISELFKFDASRPDVTGYLIEHAFNPLDVLFHYSWTNDLGLQRWMPIETILEQQEVMLIGGNTYKVRPFKQKSNHSLNRSVEKYEPEWMQLVKTELQKRKRNEKN